MDSTYIARRQRLRDLLGNSEAHQPQKTRRPAGNLSVPATPAQHQFWCIDQLAQGQAVVDVARAWRLTGRFDAERFRTAMGRVIAKYDCLRCSLLETDGTLQMLVREEQAPDSTETDLRHSPGSWEEAFAAERQRSFDLERGPLIRARAYRVGERDWMLLLVCHHAILDGWSLGQFQRELSAFYADPARSAERPAFDFGDYARKFASEESALAPQQALAHYSKVLEASPDLRLPYDYALPKKPDFNAGNTAIAIDLESRRRIEALAGHLHVSPISVVMSAFRVALFEISGQRDFCIGNTAMNRNAPDLQSMVGPFVKTMPIRQSLTPGASFEQICREAHQTIGSALSGDVGALTESPEAWQQRHEVVPLGGFDVVLNFRGYSTRDLALPGCEAVPLPLSSRSAQFKLVLTLERCDAGFEGELVWNSALFSKETAQRIADQLDATLERVLQTPAAPVESARQAGASRILSAPAPDSSLPVVKLLEQAFADHAGEPALSAGDQEWSYRDLEAASSAWASALIDAPGSAGDLVALALPRGAEFIAALIGIMRSGRAFLPLSPADPPDRLKRILELAHPKHVIGSAELGKALGLPVLAPKAPAAIPRYEWQPEELAYVMFTSGSTGEPKGVAIPHLALSNLLAGVCEVFSPKTGDRMLSASSPTFDSVIYEFLIPLTTGGKLVMIEEVFRKDPWHIAEKMRTVAPNHFFATPSLWQMLLEADLPDLPGLNALIGGEALSPRLGAKVLPRVGRLFNVYGPTEATVFSTWCAVHSSEEPARPYITSGHPIGRPLPGYSVAIVGPDGVPVWPGQVGEIWLSGPGIATGYYKAPERTRKSFVSGAGTPAPGRWYKTGDLGRVLNNGSIGYAGRVDEQLKISGQRVEPGEIENLIVESGLAKAASVLSAEIGNTNVLCAFFVPQGEATETEVRHYFRANLPSAWVPGIVVSLDAFPLTVSGKQDKAALRRQATHALSEESKTENADVPIAPALRNAWAQTLGQPPASADQNFFDAGGNSHLMIKLLAAIRDQTKCHLSVVDAFADPTPTGIDRLLATAIPLELHEDLAVSREGSGADPLVFLPGLPMTGPNLNDTLQSMPDDKTVYSLQRSAHSIAEPNSSFADKARQFAKILHTSFPKTSLHLAGFSYGGAEAFETARQLAALGAPKPRLTIIDTSPIFAKLPEIKPNMRARGLAMEHLRRAHAFQAWCGDIRLVRGDRPTLISLAMIAYGWEDFATGEISVHLLSGNHMQMLNDRAKMTSEALLGSSSPDAIVKPMPGASDRRRVAHLIAEKRFDAALDVLCQASREHLIHPWSALVADRLATEMGEDRSTLLSDWIDTTPAAPPADIPALAWHAGRAHALKQLKSPKAAVVEIETARQKSRPIRDLEVNYAMLLRQTGRDTEAVEVLSNARDRWGHTFQIGLNLGICLAKLSQFEKALPYLREYCQHNSQNELAQSWLIRAEEAVRRTA